MRPRIRAEETGLKHLLTRRHPWVLLFALAFVACCVYWWYFVTPEEGRRFKIHMSGEDLPYERGQKADIVLVSGGANLDPEHALWFPELLAAWSNIFKNPRDRGKPIRERKGPDVLYRSSLCNKDREDAVGVVRRHVEAAGFNFLVGGLCGGTGFPLNDAWSEYRGWTECTECWEAKIVLGFERFTPEYAYLGEKLFFPMEYGAVSAYRGNGHVWMDLMSVNRRAFIDREDFTSDDDFAQGIVALLKDPNRMQRMQNEEVFLNLDNAKARVDFWKDPLEVGWKGFPELQLLLEKNSKYQRLKNKPHIKYAVTRVYHHTVERFVRFLFPKSNVERVQDLEKADVEVYRCC